MDGITPLVFSLALVAAALIALAVLWVIGRTAGHSTAVPASDDLGARTARFVFKDDILVDQDTPSHDLPGLASGTFHTWSDLRAWFGHRFGPLPSSLNDLAAGETRDLPAAAQHDAASLAVTCSRTAVRVELSDPAQPTPLGQHRNVYLEGVVNRFQSVLDNAPCAVCILSRDGQRLWQNEQFAQWPEDHTRIIIEAGERSDATSRVHIPGEHNGQDRHFEVTQIDLIESVVIYASDISQIAQAEKMRREFIQTLTKTFANLTTGLAVFDRHRRLALFNPALLDLTGLPAPFLSAQPPLMEFFDRLRDNRVLPEPKNYTSWRNQIDEILLSAADDLYLEDWDLPSGNTFRVTGRPHPDGAVAFLFEDITDNISLARRFRSQINLREAVLDASDQAKIVFGPENIVTMSNQVCRSLLGIDPDGTFADLSLRDFLNVCNEKLPQPMFWDRVEEAVIQRKCLDDMLHQEDGMAYICRVRNLPGNSVVLTLRSTQPSMTGQEKELC